MNIEITAVTQAKVTINGQALAREYAESILLPLMVAAQGKNSPAILKVAQAFATAGLSLKAVPAANGRLSDPLGRASPARCPPKG